MRFSARLCLIADADLRNELRELTPSAAKSPSWNANLESMTDPASGRLRCKYTIGWAVVASPGYLLVRAWISSGGAGQWIRTPLPGWPPYSILLAGWLGLLLAYALVRRLAAPGRQRRQPCWCCWAADCFTIQPKTSSCHTGRASSPWRFCLPGCSIAWGRLDSRGYWLLLGFLAGLMCTIRAPTSSAASSGCIRCWPG